VSEICRSFAFNISLQDGISSTDLGPTVVWDCVLVLVSIFVATLPAVTTIVERAFECFQRHPAPDLYSISVATLLRITMIERVFKYLQPHQVPDLEMQTPARYRASLQESAAALMSPVPSNRLSTLHSPTLKWPERAYRGGGDNLTKSSGGEVSSCDPEERILYHAI
jgi:hypothetical protein